MKAKIFCEVTCLNCGTVALGSRFYKNKDTISKLKELTKEWIYSEKFGGNLCPNCQEDLNIRN